MPRSELYGKIVDILFFIDDPSDPVKVLQMSEWNPQSIGIGRKRAGAKRPDKGRSRGQVE
jgi:hypothetical protein